MRGRLPSLQRPFQDRLVGLLDRQMRTSVLPASPRTADPSDRRPARASPRGSCGCLRSGCPRYASLVHVVLCMDSFSKYTRPTAIGVGARPQDEVQRHAPSRSSFGAAVVTFIWNMSSRSRSVSSRRGHVGDRDAPCSTGVGAVAPLPDSPTLTRLDPPRSRGP